MNSINRQLNIGVIPPNITLPSRYARASRQYQVQLGSEDPSLDYYNDSASLDNMSNASGYGWENAEGDRDLGDEMMADLDEYNGFVGLAISYPACVKSQCKECKNECKSTKGLKWLKGGKACYNECRSRKASEQMDRINTAQGEGNIDAVKTAIVEEDTKEAGLSAGAKVALAVGGLAILGISLFLIMRKK
jgi:hypothetical protein